MVSDPPFLRPLLIRQKWDSLLMEPNRILAVTIHQMLYPITVEALHQVFGSYGDIEKIEINGFQAMVQFQWSHSAAVARVGLQGRCIYDGCCQMDIQFSGVDVVNAEVEEKKAPNVTMLQKTEDPPVAHQLFDERSEQKLEVIEPQTEKSQISAPENPPGMMKTSAAAMKTETMASFWESWAAEMKEQNESIRQALAALLEEVRRMKKMQVAMPEDDFKGADAFLEDEQMLPTINLVDEAATRLKLEITSKPTKLDGMDRTVLELKNSVENRELVESGFSITPKKSFYCGDRGVVMLGSVAVHMFDKLPSIAAQDDILWNSTADEYFRFGYLKESIARSVVLGPDQPVILHMLDIPSAAETLNGERRNGEKRCEDHKCFNLQLPGFCLEEACRGKYYLLDKARKTENSARG